MTLARAVPLALLLFGTACRTSARLPTFEPLAAATPLAAWEHLVSLRESFSGVRLAAQFRTETPAGRESFRATVEIEHVSGFRLQLFSPIGIAVATVMAEGDDIRWTAAGEEKRMPVSELGRRLLGNSLQDWRAGDVAMLLVGLPPEGEASVVSGGAEAMVMQGSRFSYAVTSRGLREVSGGAVRVTFVPPAFPAERLIFKSEEGTLEVEILERSRP